MVHDDGTVDLNVDGPCSMGLEILNGLQKGVYDGISIAPSIAPVVASALNAEDVLPEITRNPYAYTDEGQILQGVPPTIMLVPPQTPQHQARLEQR